MTARRPPASLVLVDTSIWIDHLHRTDPALVLLLEADAVATHPLVIEELALGSIARRDSVINALSRLHALPTVTHAEVMHLISATPLWGCGLSAVDAHLLAAVLVTPGATLWTRDKRLGSAASDRGVAYTP